MSDMEKEVFRQIGINLINEYRQQRGIRPIQFLDIRTPEINALIRSIQLHEKTKQELADCKQELSDFRQTVSDAILRYLAPTHVPHGLKGFIIPAPKPDPLADVLDYLEWPNKDALAKDIRASLDALGFEIREKNDD